MFPGGSGKEKQRRVPAPGFPIPLSHSGSVKSEFGLVGVFPGLSAFWLICGSKFHDDAHGAFMKLTHYTSIREQAITRLNAYMDTQAHRQQRPTRECM